MFKCMIFQLGMIGVLEPSKVNRGTNWSNQKKEPHNHTPKQYHINIYFELQVTLTCSKPF